MKKTQSVPRGDTFMTLACRCGAAGGDSVSDEVVVNDTAARFGMDGEKGAIGVCGLRMAHARIGLVWVGPSVWLQPPTKHPKHLGKFRK